MEPRDIDDLREPPTAPHAPHSPSRLSLPSDLPWQTRGSMTVREPGGFRRGEVVSGLALVMGAFVQANRLGTIVTATGFQLGSDPASVRTPAIAFVHRDRVPRPSPWGYAELAPDLAVEVAAPDDLLAPVLTKVAEWLTAGTRLVWVVDIERQAVHVYRADGSAAALGPGDLLDGESVLPGFTVPVSEIV